MSKLSYIIRSSPSNSSSAAVAYDCGAILNATTANGEDEQQETPLANEAYEDAKLNCMLKAIMPRRVVGQKFAELRVRPSIQI